MRAFIGIALPDGARSALAELQRDLRASGADVKWVAPSNLHVTLKFLDDITDAQRAVVEDMLRNVAVPRQAFPLQLEQVGAFPSVTAPRVVWVGTAQGRDEARGIAEAIEAGSRDAGLRREERPFAAHVTVGRVRSPKNRQALAERLAHTTWQPPEVFRVTSVTLYRSELSSSGPRYRVVADVPLGV